MGTIGNLLRGIDRSTGNSLTRYISKAYRSLQIGRVPQRWIEESKGNTTFQDYKLLEENLDYPASSEKLRMFYNLHKGERCFIIGNGPSLNKIDLSKLRDEFTFGVNGIFYKTEEMGFQPTYYVVEDSFVLKDNLEKIRAFSAKQKFFPAIYRRFLEETGNTCFFTMNRGFYEPSSPHFQIPRFSKDCSEKIYCGQTVTYINLQLAHFMGFKEVYLIGMDFTYVIPQSAKLSGLDIESTEDDPNHFHPEYFGKGKRWHDPQLDMVLRNYEFANLVYKWTDRKIYNATAGGNLEVFERRNYEELFKR